MFKIKNKNIYLNRGDAVSLVISLSNNTFKPNDTLKFTVVEQNDFTNIVLSKTTVIVAENASATIELKPTDTRIGKPLKNGSKTYWYEIELNNEITLLGFDDEGPKLFVLYPEAEEVV